MPLTIGSRLGHYDVTALIGEGGHGEVYQARDTKLDRDVAPKLQRFASVHGVVLNLFRVGRHLLRAVHHRLLRARAFVEWDVVACVC